MREVGTAIYPILPFLHLLVPSITVLLNISFDWNTSGLPLFSSLLFQIHVFSVLFAPATHYPSYIGHALVPRHPEGKLAQETHMHIQVEQKYLLSDPAEEGR